jgi:hypothetical protein
MITLKLSSNLYINFKNEIVMEVEKRLKQITR